MTTIYNEGTETFVFPGPNMYITEDVSYGLNLYDAQGWATMEGGVMDLPAPARSWYLGNDDVHLHPARGGYGGGDVLHLQPQRRDLCRSHLERCGDIDSVVTLAGGRLAEAAGDLGLAGVLPVMS